MRPTTTPSALEVTPRSDVVESSRADFLTNVALVTSVATVSFASPAQARGRATLESSYDR